MGISNEIPLFFGQIAYIIYVDHKRNNMNRPPIETLHRTNISERYFKKNYPEIHSYIVSNLTCVTEWKEKLYLYYHDLETPPKCPICGKNAKFETFFKGYHTYCSVQCSGKSESRLNKIHSTMVDKYGVSHALQSDVFRDKYKTTCLERYGVENKSSTTEYKEKFTTTMIERYGGVGSSSKDICDKVRETRRSNRLNDMVIPNHIGYCDDGKWIMRCDCPIDGCSVCESCDGTYTIYSGNHFDRVRLNNTLCTKVNPVDPMKIKGTEIERFVTNILDECGIEYETNVRTVIPPKEVDIYIPSKGIAIECNGVFWHSMKDPSYHYDKFDTCRKVGIQLLTIWEDWVRTKPDILRSIIVNKLCLTKNKVYARECEVRPVVSRQCSSFLNDNHIQGSSNSAVKLGLYHKNELVSVMTFGKSRLGVGQNETGWELVRFCNKLNTTVVGGASKLLNHFIRHHNPKKIVSYSANDISDGGLYRMLGFVSDGKVGRSYWYVSQKDFVRYHRFKFRKTILKDMGYDADNMTESEIMKQLPYWRIYDCGTSRWVLLFNE